jgi:hypothetical protein
VAVPVGSADDCTLLIKIFRAPNYRYGEYPFTPSRTATRVWLDTPPLVQLETVRYLLTSESKALSREPFGRPIAGGNSLAYRAEVPTFTSEEILGDGTAQVTPHGLVDGSNVSVAPAKVRVIPVKWPASSACSFTSSSDTSEVTVTMTLGVTYIIMAWAPG